MTKFLPYCILLFLLHSISYAQISIGFDRTFTISKEKIRDFTDEELKEIKSNTLVFFYRASDERTLPELEKALKSVWKITPLKLVPYSQADKYLNEPNYSYASISTFIHGDNSPTSSKRAVWYMLLDFWLNKPQEKIPRKSFAWVYLSTGSGIPAMSIYSPPISPSFGSYAIKAGGYYTDGFFGKGAMIDLLYKIKANPLLIKEKKIPMTDDYYKDLYTNSIILTWNIPDLKAYFAVVNDHLQAGQVRTFIHEENDANELQNLKNSTLVIPEYAFLKVGKSSKEGIDYVQATEEDREKTLSGYPYRYKILNEEKLTEAIMDSSRTTYYLIHIVNNSKTVAIVNSKTGKIIYTKGRIVLSGEHLREKDMILLKEAIDGERK
ncbi:hypothetical protein QNI19_36020 [Cytophagaceae bacterium DM2B3-1]|uniref:Uncharacterized protein n=1 Tax=Xanthocytophaga flava TaxID=3048013 RepID=A0ABT7CXE9_9BACT|nr:hypothetical protein [Xanthocytophaga flavus]MDJ1498398.1 hypothetical protein [Xanthocytophaga flavus]